MQANKFSSIPEAMWWGVNVMTTLGDAVYRLITPNGKIIGGLISILGVALFALPICILDCGFAEQKIGNK